jgi:hypothetical protein
MDIPYLSRKFVLSAALAVVATLFMALTLIQPHEWMWVVMATVVSYVTANAIQDKTMNNYVALVNGKKTNLATIWERVKSLFDRVFLLAVTAVTVTSVFLLKGIIPSDVWFMICSALASAYNIGNAVGKS